MGRIYCVMGKSASGKDSIYHEVMKQEPELLPIVPYTTRPIRQGEIEGREYHFCDEARVEELEKAHRIIELRAYDTVYGIWKYFTVADEHMIKCAAILVRTKLFRFILKWKTDND